MESLNEASDQFQYSEPPGEIVSAATREEPLSEVYPLLTRLSVNRQFMSDFLSAATPCFAIGMLEERKRACGFFVLRPNEVIPPEISDAGFLFGHGLIGNTDFEVVHFAFHFYGFKTYDVLVNPNNPLVRTVLTTMVESEDYLFFALDSQGGATIFRSECGQADLAGLQNHLPRIQRSVTTDAQYEQAVSFFQKNPGPPDVLLDWVCRDRLEYLDVTADCLELTPSGGRKTWD